MEQNMNQKQKLEICNKVIMHWWENLFLAYAEDLQLQDLNSNKCEFCVQFHTGCVMDMKSCPISKYTGSILCYGTNYQYIANKSEWAINDKKLIKLVSGMLVQLEKICDK